MKKSKYLSALHVYPVKSCKGLDQVSVQVGLKGPDLDRRWMVVDAKGHFLSQRQHHQMALIEVSINKDKLILKIPNEEEYTLTIGSRGEERSVVVWKNNCLAIDQGNAIAEKLSRFLNMECRLVFMPDETFRQVDPAYAIKATDQVGFADAYPFLLISEASLEDLNKRLDQPIGMNRFRPNLVIEGCEPYEEDTWKKFRIGKIIFSAVKPCSRCVVTTVEQSSGVKGLEPLQTLAEYRKREKGIMFGQNLVHHNEGVLKVGEELEVLEWISSR